MIEYTKTQAARALGFSIKKLDKALKEGLIQYKLREGRGINCKTKEKNLEYVIPARELRRFSDEYSRGKYDRFFGLYKSH